MDTGQLLRSAAAVAAILDREIARGIDSRRIVLAGFSQGGAVAYQAALAYAQPLAGLLVLSAYFPTADSITPNAANANLPVRICHGTLDPVVPEALGREAHRRLLAMGHAAEYQAYPIGHQVSPDEILDIARWLRGVLAL